MQQWRERMLEWLRQGREAGEVITDEPDERIVDALLATATGLQVNVLVLPETTTPDRRREPLGNLRGGIRAAGFPEAAPAHEPR